MEKILQAFKFGDLQTYLNITLKLEEYGKTVKDLEHYVKEVRKPKVMPTRKCPKCSSTMFLYPGDDNDAHWVCKKCRFSIYKEVN